MNSRSLLGFIYGASFLAAVGVGTCGCRQSASASGDRDHPSHVGHERPQHWPESLQAAARQLRLLSERVEREPDQEAARGHNLRIALDIAGWLPELAADSDMPESNWNEVVRLADMLRAEFERQLSYREVDRTRILPALNDPLGRLERLACAATGEGPTGGGSPAR